MMKKFRTEGRNYNIPQIDLSVKPENTENDYLYELITVNEGDGYLGHPDSVLTTSGAILTVYPAGHGKGAVIMSESDDGGLTYKTRDDLPRSFENSRETPTLYRLDFNDGTSKLALFSACPRWPGESTTGGFNASFSNDDGKTFSEFKLYFAKNEKKGVIPIVAMSSLVKLKENGKFVDKWMGIFHDSRFYNYKTVLSFDENGAAVFTEPEKYFAAYRKAEKKTKMCEVLMLRSDCGKGDELMIVTRSNTKNCNSLISFSSDEGKTWSEPKEAPSAVNGERHKAVYTKDGRLFITFRSIERDKEKLKKYSESNRAYNWYSEGYVAWVGTYDDLRNGREGQYRLKIAHTYLDYQTEPSVTANGDTAYCGNVVLDDGTIVTCSYGIFSTEEKETGVYKTDKGRKKRKTYIASKRIRLEDTDSLAKIQKQ